jgi:hypothetical protein
VAGNPTEAALWEALESYLESLEDIPFAGIGEVPWDAFLGAKSPGEVSGSISFPMSGEPEGLEDWQQEHVISLAVRMVTANPRGDYLNMIDYQATIGEAMLILGQNGLPVGEFRGFVTTGGLRDIKPAGGIQHCERSINVSNVDGSDARIAQIDLMMRYTVTIPNNWAGVL